MENSRREWLEVRAPKDGPGLGVFWEGHTKNNLKHCLGFNNRRAPGVLGRTLLEECLKANYCGLARARRMDKRPSMADAATALGGSAGREGQ